MTVIDMSHWEDAFRAPSYEELMQKAINDLMMLGPQTTISIDALEGEWTSPYIPEQIIFNGDHTICIFFDGSKEIAWPSEDDEFQPEVGVAMCIMKKLYGSRTQFKKAVEEGYRQDA